MLDNTFPGAPESLIHFMEATKTNDTDAMVAALADGAELISPLFARATIRGRDDLAVLLSTVYGSLTDLEWTEVIGDDLTWVAVSRARIGRVGIGDAMIVTIDDSGRIAQIRPHLRPLLGAVIFAAYLGPRLARRPALLRRSLRR